jgi:hypothetical protein
MNSGGLARTMLRRKYRTSFIGRNKRIRFRLSFGALSLFAGLGVIIVNLVRNL